MTRVLVTGASGFIASHCVLDLLTNGYEVTGTIRNLDRADKLRGILAKHHEGAANLELHAATLDSAQGWQEAMARCDTVFHVASPVPTIQPEDPMEVIEPARQGTLNVLKAAKAAGIKRIVLTSSVAAVQGSGKGTKTLFTADDWSDPDSPKLTPYSASKTIAERDAWNFAEANDLELSVVNPALVLGPALESDYGSSLEALMKVMTGELPMLPKLGFEIVDVRDVAALHRLAFEANQRQRYLCGAGFLWFKDIANILRAEFPDNKKIPSRNMPNFLARIAAIFVKEIASFIDDLDLVKELDCSPAKAIGWNPRSPEIAVIDGGRSLVEFGLVK